MKRLLQLLKFATLVGIAGCGSDMTISTAGWKGVSDPVGISIKMPTDWNSFGTSDPVKADSASNLMRPTAAAYLFKSLTATIKFCGYNKTTGTAFTLSRDLNAFKDDIGPDFMSRIGDAKKVLPWTGTPEDGFVSDLPAGHAGLLRGTVSLDGADHEAEMYIFSHNGYYYSFVFYYTPKTEPTGRALIRAIISTLEFAK